MPTHEKKNVYKQNVYDDTETSAEQLESIKEYCLTLRELRGEDWRQLASLQDRVKELEAHA